MGPAVGMVAAMLGKPLMEWQQYVADVILEIDPETGRLAYSEYLLTVPRQSGKSIFILAKATHRASATKFFGRRQRLVYTAQTRLKAREKWEEDFVEDLLASRRLRASVSVHKGNGNEHVRFGNGSRFGIESNTEKAGHGGTLDEAFIDEAFAQVDNRLEQAFRPAMITRLNKQLGVVSTAGWLDASPYLLGKVRLGRRLVEQDVRRGTAYFEWSAPDDADPGDELVWLECMPAVHRPDCEVGCRRHTITLEAIRAEYDKAVQDGKLADFRRAYLNQWVPKPTEAEATIVDLEVWNSQCRWDVKAGRASSKLEGVPVFAVEVSKDRGVAYIAAAGITRGGNLFEVVDYRPGTEWVAGRCKQLAKKHGGNTFVIDAASEAASLIEDLEAAGMRVITTDAREMVAACGQWYDGITTGTAFHLGQDIVDAALAGAVWRELEASRALGRKKSTVDIAPLVACVLALWGHREHGDYNVMDSFW